MIITSQSVNCGYQAYTHTDTLGLCLTVLD